MYPTKHEHVKAKSEQVCKNRIDYAAHAGHLFEPVNKYNPGSGKF